MTQTVSAVAIPGHYWAWRNNPIYYVRAGVPQPERPPLLLVHGFGASTDHWRQNIAALQTEYEVWAIDLLGFGRSAKPDIEYSGPLWCDQLQDFIATVIGRPAVLVGNSLGGYASLALAATAPQWAAGLVLLNSAGPFTAMEPAPSRPLQAAVGKLMRSLFLQPWAGFLLFQYLRQPAQIRRTLLKVYRNPAAVTEQLVADIYRPSCDRGALQVFLSVFKAPPGERNDELLQRLQCPLLTLWGEGDPWMDPQSRSAKFREHYPALVEAFLDAGHCPHDECPDLVNDWLGRWVQHCSGEALLRVGGDRPALQDVLPDA